MAPTENLHDTNRKTRYRGVRKRTWGRYGAEIHDPANSKNEKKKKKWLGTYDTAVQAAQAYDRAAIELKGLGAQTNFPLALYVGIPLFHLRSDIHTESGSGSVEVDQPPANGSGLRVEIDLNLPPPPEVLV